MFIHFQFLTILHLNGNNLISISSDISLLTNLTHLNLSNNHLKSLPLEMGKMSRLKELVLYDNFINLLPVEFGYLYQLEAFLVDGNPLVEPLFSLNQSHGGLALISFIRDNNTGIKDIHLDLLCILFCF